jgi:hypothetical protein
MTGSIVGPVDMRPLLVLIVLAIWFLMNHHHRLTQTP